MRHQIEKRKPVKRDKTPPMRVRYVELPPSDIFNSLDPQHQNCAFEFWNEWGGTWWEPETVAKRQFYAQCFKEEHDKITGHFTKLKQSILKDGLKHPILVVSGPFRDVRLKDVIDTPPWFPPDMIKNPNNALFVHTHGGSRFMMAEELNLTTVPCAVIDFANKFPDAIELTQSNYKQYFGTGYHWTHMNVRIVNRQHIHLQDDPKYNSMNQATRAAQSTARKKATERTRQRYNNHIHVDPTLNK